MGLFSPEIPTKNMVPLCRQLATAYDAGIPIIQVFESVSSQSGTGKTRRVMREIAADLRSGSGLDDAVKKQSKFLSPIFVHLLATGEVGGRLEIMLKDLADFYEDRLRMQRQIAASMFLPAVELAAAWFLGSFALGILSVVQEAIDGTGGGTKGVTAYVDRYIQLQMRAGVVVVFFFIIAVILARMGVLRWVTGFVSTYIWPLSTVTRHFALARFFRSLSLLIGSGLSITRCVQNAAAVTSNPYMERDLLKAVPHIKRGSTLVEAFSHTRFLTPVSRDMLAVGEESGNLEFQLRKTSEYHMQDGNTAAERTAKIFGLMIMFAVFVLVGGIIISFYANLYGGIMDELGV